MSKITPCIWSNHTAEEQANFYVTLLPDGKITRVERTPPDKPSQKAVDVIVVMFHLGGLDYVLLNGGPMCTQSEAVSLMIHTDDQAETDRIWNAIVDNGGAESQCGWCKDKWGLSWQITPRALLEAVTDPDRAAAKRAFDAILEMKKLDIATIEAARRGATRT